MANTGSISLDSGNVILSGRRHIKCVILPANANMVAESLERRNQNWTVRMKAANDLIIQVGDSICQLHKRRSHGGKGTLTKIQSENFTGGSEIFEIAVKCSAMDGRFETSKHMVCWKLECLRLTYTDVKASIKKTYNSEVICAFLKDEDSKAEKEGIGEGVKDFRVSINLGQYEVSPVKKVGVQICFKCKQLWCVQVMKCLDLQAL